MLHKGFIEPFAVQSIFDFSRKSVIDDPLCSDALRVLDAVYIYQQCIRDVYVLNERGSTTDIICQSVRRKFLEITDYV